MSIGPKTTAKFSLQQAGLTSLLLPSNTNSGLCTISAVNCANLHGTVLPLVTTGTDYVVLITDALALTSLGPFFAMRGLGFNPTRLLVTFVEGDMEW